MTGVIGNMNKYLITILLSTGLLYADDNEISVDQSGATANIDLEQLGSGNIIGGADAVAGTMTPLDLDGGTMTLDINQIGSSNQFLGDIFADTFTGFFEFDGDSNIFNITVDPTDTYGADSGNFNVNITGNSNEFDLDVATAAMASTLDLDWIINGSSNDLTFTIDYDLATNYLDIDGSDNTITFDADGYAGGYFYLDHTGSNRTFNIQQQSTLDNDWLKIISNGSNGTVCVIQNDGGISTSC